MLIEPAIWLVDWLYASLIRFNSCRLKVSKKGMTSHAVDVAVYAKKILIFFVLQPCSHWSGLCNIANRSQLCHGGHYHIYQ